MRERAPDFKKILQVLVAHGVEFVVIGGVGAVLDILRAVLEEKKGKKG